MKLYKYLVIIFILGIPVSNFAQKSLRSFIGYQVFYSPVQKLPYIETYITVVGNSTSFKRNENGKFQSTIEIVMLFKQDGKIMDFRKHNLKSPEIEDNSKIKPTFIDQQRIPIAPGIYNFELVLRDLNDTLNNDKKYNFNDIISVNIDTTDIDMSGIELVEKYNKSSTENSFSKNGYDIIPYVSNYYPQNLKKIIFYSEIYNTDLKKFNGEDFLLDYYIENDKDKTIVNDCRRFKKQKASNVVVIFNEFDIEKLRSGNYNLVVEAKNKNNQTLISRKTFFQRSNPEYDAKAINYSEINVENIFTGKITNNDTLTEYLKCIRPIADGGEKSSIDNLVKSTNRENKQKFFYYFWQLRNNNNPEAEWNSYLKQVNLVNNTYTTRIKKGYETDMGRVFLQYGAPNNRITDEHDPSAYPYEIWQYERIKDQSNRRFIFYNPELSGRDYTLLYSDVKGEIAPSNWEMVLHKRDTPRWNFDQNQGIEYYGGHAEENFKK
jgi:GWxTD domain-containing protein